MSHVQSQGVLAREIERISVAGADQGGATELFLPAGGRNIRRPRDRLARLSVALSLVGAIYDSRRAAPPRPSATSTLRHIRNAARRVAPPCGDRRAAPDPAGFQFPLIAVREAKV